MSTVSIDRFDGGIALDARQANTNEFAIAQHFDIFSKRHKLLPYRAMEDEAGTLGTYKIGSVELFTDSAGTQNLFALGNTDGGTFPQILEKSANIVTGTFAISTTGAGAAGIVIPTTLRGYKNQNKLYFMKTLSGNTVVDSYNPATDAYVSTVGTITGTSSTGVYPRPFRHPQDDIMYFGAGNIVASLNAATFTAAALTLPVGLTITSFTDYGVYLAIACAPIDQGNKSWVFLWGRDTSLTTVEETIDFGEGALMVLENVGGSLVGISAHSQAAGTIIDIEPKITFRAYSGGTPRIIKEIKWTGTGTPTTLLKNLKAKKNDAVYFACKQYIENKTVNQIWMCGRNTQGQFFVTPDRLANNDTALTGNVDGLDIIGDYMWTAYNGDGSLKRTNDAASFTATSIYESAIFGSEDVGYEKKLVAVGVMTEPLPADGQIVLKFRKNEGTTFSTIFTHTTDDSLFHDAINIEGRTATMTIASPAVVTATAHGLVAGNAIYFTTTGALPTGVTANTTYYVISTGLTADTFQFSATSGGSAVNTSGTQSGTHTLLRLIATFPTYREIQFRIESTGGAVPIGFKFKFDLIPTNLSS